MILDVITRTYKNGSSTVIAIQTLTVYAETVMTTNKAGYLFTKNENIDTRRFARTGKVYVKTEKTIQSSGSQVVASVTTSGSFNTSTTVGGDLESVTYLGDSDGVNDLIIPITGFTEVYTIGDTV